MYELLYINSYILYIYELSIANSYNTSYYELSHNKIEIKQMNSTDSLYSETSREKVNSNIKSLLPPTATICTLIKFTTVRNCFSPKENVNLSQVFHGFMGS